MAIVNRHKPWRPGKIRMILYLVAALLFLVVGFGGVKYYRWFYQSNIFPGNLEEDYLYIPTGAVFDDVVQLLTYNHWLADSEGFIRVSQLTHYDQMVRAGRYKVTQGMNNFQLVSLLRRGAQSPVRLTFNNIRTLEQLAGVVAQKLEPDSAGMLNFMTKDSVAQAHGFEKITFMALFIPNTYEFFWNTSSAQWVERMAKEYGRFWNESRRSKADSIGLTPIEVSVLASIVDEETNKNAEKSAVAGLYLNRLRIGMPLQADPTIKFSLGDFGIRRILKSDLDVNSPYNTYKYAGLPPGPIRIPSVEGLDAVLNAQAHPYIYMCAKDDFSGYHSFAATYGQHQENARRYQKALRNARIFR